MNPKQPGFRDGLVMTFQTVPPFWPNGCLGDFAIFLALGHQKRAKMASAREFIAIVVMVHWPTMSWPLSFLSHLMSFPSSLYLKRFRILTSPSNEAASDPAGSLHSSASRFSASALLRRDNGIVGSRDWNEISKSTWKTNIYEFMRIEVLNLFVYDLLWWFKIFIYYRI